MTEVVTMAAMMTLPPASAVLGEAESLLTAVARLTELAARAAEWAAPDRRMVLQLLDRAVDGLATVRATVLVAERDAGTWQGAGDRSFEAWRGRTGRTGDRSAAAQVRQADELSAVPLAAAAVAAGRITLEHATTLGKVARTGTPAQQHAAQDAVTQAHLLDAAERLDAGTFATTVARWAATVDPDALEADHQAQRRERFLHVTPTPRGTFVKGRLDSMAGHRLTLALEALTPRPAPDDDRDPGQRHADALDAMAGRILALADTKPGGHVPPQVTMILTAETWSAARAERDRRRTEGSGSGSRPLPAGGQGGGCSEALLVASHPPATLEDGTPVPASEVAAAMCDCALTRLVLDADGVPLDLGRSARVFTGDQRRAVIARDRHCAWPGCTAHARWCEVHHIRWWERDDGPTSTDNGVLLCSYHHHEVHRRDLTITRDGPPGARRRSPEGQRRPSLTIAIAGYTFRDRAGGLVGPSPVPPEPDTVPPPSQGAATTRDPRARTDPPELRGGTDPVTGCRVPQLLLTP